MTLLIKIWISPVVYTSLLKNINANYESEKYLSIQNEYILYVYYHEWPKIPIFLFKIFEHWHLNSFLYYLLIFLSDLHCGHTKETLDEYFQCRARDGAANAKIMSN